MTDDTPANNNLVSSTYNHKRYHPILPKVVSVENRYPHVIEVDFAELPSTVEKEFISKFPEELSPEYDKPTVEQIRRLFEEHCYEGTAAAIEHIQYLKKTFAHNGNQIKIPVEEKRTEIEPLCRICACSSDQLIDLFSEKGQKEQILSKIHTHLPIMVNNNTTLPSSVCQNCWESVNKWHSFVTSCLEADIRLKRINSLVTDNEHIENNRKYSVTDVSKIMISHYQSNIVCTSDVISEDNDTDDVSNASSNDVNIDSRETEVADSEIESDEERTQLQTNTNHKEFKAEDIETINLELEGVQDPLDIESEIVVSSEREAVEQVTTPSQKTKKKRKKMICHCDACYIVFASCDQLVSHLISVHNIKVFSCSLCNIVFNASEVSFKQHMSTCRKKNQEKCTSLNLKINKSLKLSSEDMELLFSQFVTNENNSYELETNQNNVPEENNLLQTDSESVSSCVILNENESENLENIEVTKIVVSKDNVITDASSITVCKDKEKILPVKKNALNLRQIETINSTKFDCTLCKKKIKTKRQFTLHCIGRHEGMDVRRLKPICYSCDMCGKKYYGMRNLKRHIKLHSIPKIKFSCIDCGKLCISKYRLEIHKKRHEVTQRKHYLCDLCGKECKNKRYLKCHQENHDGRNYICGRTVKCIKQHMKNHLREKIRYMCDICGKIFLNNKYRLRQHMSLHTGEVNYKCPQCPKSFYMRSNYKQHLLQHDAVPRFKCDFCDKRFRRKNYKNIHAKTHFCEKNLTCHICMKPCKTDKDLFDHRTQHTQEEIETYKMKQKKILSKRKTKFSDSKHFTCNICGKDFKYRASLCLHKKVHGSEKNLKCHVCGKEFPHSVSLQLHYQIHTGEKAHHCSYCDASFRFKSSLQTHMYRHTGEKPFSCEICDKSFRAQTLLTQHKSIHSSERPFSCNVCDGRFKRRTTLHNHLRIHTGERPYKCKICSRAFKQCSDRKKHVELHYKKGDVPETCEHDLTIEIPDNIKM